jgi:hypothetical protein
VCASVLLCLITKESFAIGDVARGYFILVKLAGKGAFLITQLK